MPIYAYKCGSCGHAKDVLQKISDAPLTDCPACGKATFSKQLTAAGFQLKGSGWYATDFKGGSGGTSAPAAAAGTAAAAAAAASDTASASTSASADSATSAAKPAATGGCATGCACH
ncbi:MAG: FmdB family transcriptional regulator [Burkholderiales bacterium 35-55-47]|jgi:putative FmdB family regulatory protein|uniref:FmdB family zinc ribbon protein n=1 Tax=Limnohabitans sp. TaxID=1907725 RepID=UPI000BC86D22|nr:FmdB family zinc ribbon protein [Limnohabitans sp.]OYY20292.1 MAG: FmdB family transcriptional regulator [Burkholderiales bacterium 35-55-47]OYZ74096.1 MAG: FmdB family transcriptional regulator [Burkholderiales bacterium 24-55-52]OZB02012.1 MAG: FmdB family transcriptional regulator [Burkholderiales bacterium 39-55-53]HQR86549.1 zinc ribbon domain-containing protein [Limnohabitans sp.]HQS28034.1 zinc ribbon domain-containing protein [Limnohabitans sp.]